MNSYHAIWISALAAVLLSLVALALLSLVRVTQQQGYIATRRRSL